MITNEIRSIDQFRSDFNGKLSILAKKWALPDFDINHIDDSRLVALQTAAQYLVNSIAFRLSSVRGDGKIEAKILAYFKELQSKGFEPNLNITAFGNLDKDKLIDARKLLRDFSYHLGKAAEQQTQDILHPKKPVEPAWLKTGLVPVETIALGEWGPDTIPQPNVKEYNLRFFTEMVSIQEIVKNANPADLKIYIQEILQPRYVDIKGQLEALSQKLNGDTNLLNLQYSETVDFAEFLESQLSIAQKRIQNEASLPSLSEFPKGYTVIEDIIVEGPDFSAHHQALLIALEDSRKPAAVIIDNQDMVDSLIQQGIKIDKLVRGLSGTALIKFYDKELHPTYKAALEDFHAHRNDPVRGIGTPIGEVYLKHLDFLKAQVTQCQEKIRDVDVPVLRDEVIIQKHAKEEIKPLSDKNMAEVVFRIGVMNQLDSLKGQGLKNYHDGVLVPSFWCLKGELETLKTVGAPDTDLSIKENKLRFIGEQIKRATDLMRSSSPQLISESLASSAPIETPELSGKSWGGRMAETLSTGAKLVEKSLSRLFERVTKNIPSLSSAWKPVAAVVATGVGGLALAASAGLFQNPDQEAAPKSQRMETTSVHTIALNTPANDVAAPVATIKPVAVAEQSVELKPNANKSIKKSFAPAVVVISAPIIEKPFDITEFRGDFTSLINACKQAGVVRVGGVCESIISPKIN